MSVRLITADVLEGLAQLPDESVHCCVTSPPYWGLRDYGVTGQIGLEPTPEAFVAKMVEVFREVRRVLRADGTLWCNLGDSYATQGGPGWQGKNGQRADRRFTLVRDTVPMREVSRSGAAGCKPKDLIGMPWRVAFALQADGWWLRSDIVWSKPNPMPESVTDRPTKAHEYLFLLTKAERYYYDAEAVKETRASDENANTFRGGSYVGGVPGPRVVVGNSAIKGGQSLQAFPDGSRNKRSVWTIATAPFPEAHFATFPPKLAEDCIKAGTSEHRCCATCRAPWVRHTEVAYDNPGNRTTNGARSLFAVRLEKRVATTGWAPSCDCGAEAGIAPCVVLDPFSGAGTTAMVADRLGRDAIGIELNPDYVAMSERRIARDRLERKKGTMADVAAAKLPLTPLEALMQEGPA